MTACVGEALPSQAVSYFRFAAPSVGALVKEIMEGIG